MDFFSIIKMSAKIASESIQKITSRILETLENEVAERTAGEFLDFFILSENNSKAFKKALTSTELDCETATYFRKYLEFFKNINDHKDSYKFFSSIDVICRIPFFAFVNSPAVQNDILFRNRRKYEYIFDLYEEWKRRILSNGVKSVGDVYLNYFDNSRVIITRENYRYIPGEQFDLVDRQIAKQCVKTYTNKKEPVTFSRVFSDGAKNNFIIKRVMSSDTQYIEKIVEFNNPADGYDKYVSNPAYYLKSEPHEIEYAAKNGYVWVIEDSDENALAAVGIYIPNVKNIPNSQDGNFILHSMTACYAEIKKNMQNSSLLDSCLVGLKYHGLGLMRLLLMICSETAVHEKKRYIYATVSEKNENCNPRFELAGYERVAQTKYTSKDRTKEYPRTIVRQDVTSWENANLNTITLYRY